MFHQASVRTRRADRLDQPRVRCRRGVEGTMHRDSELCGSTLIPYRCTRPVEYRRLTGQFAERTPGSFIENRGASIRWRYWPGNANDTELPWARRQAAEAQNHIWDRCVLPHRFFTSSISE